MIPLKDNIHSRTFPIIDILLISINVLVFLLQLPLEDAQLNQFIRIFGLVPARFWNSYGLVRWLPIFTSMFLHGGWLHLIFNMLALYIFGDNVEDRLGHFRYLVFYLLGGIIAAISHLYAYETSPLPTIGASEAIAAVLGAYLVLFPRARVLTLIPIFIFFPIIDIPAIIFLGFWFISQLLNGSMALTVETFQGVGVAWWAHIGGFIAGMLLGRLLARKTIRFHRDQYYPW